MVLFTGALSLMVVWAVRWVAENILGGVGLAKEIETEERA